MNEYLHQHLHETRHREWTARAAEERLAREVAAPGWWRRLWQRMVDRTPRRPDRARKQIRRSVGVSVTR